MANNPYEISSTPQLSKQDFKTLGSFIHSRFGIKMPEVKRGMIESRLRKRLSRLKINSYAEYCDYLFSNEGQENELTHFINVVTTNKTDFFREPHHFTYLVEKALPALQSRRLHGQKKNLFVWSCASSKGHEPYTLAMVLKNYADKYKGFDFSILATDISTRVLDIAINGIYDEAEIEPVSMELRKKFLLRNKDKKKPLVRINPQLRSKVKFHRLNLMDDHFGIAQKMDIIFCRNVIIYFDKETTDRLIQKLCRHLVKGGFIFMGHSELLDCKMLPLVSVAPAVYQKIN